MASQKEVSEWIGLSDRQVRNLQKSGVLPKAQGRGDLDLKECVKSYIRYLKSGAQEEEGQENKKESSDERLKRIRADTLEFKLSIEQGKFAPIELLSSVLSQVVEQVRSKLESVPSIIRMTQPDIRPSAIGKIEAELAAVQNQLSTIEISLPDPDGEFTADGEAFALAAENDTA
ncbi:MAG: hypothetical protein ACN2B6_11955 [Rickettsiales bacterium]